MITTKLIQEIFDAVRGRFTLTEIQSLLQTDPQRLVLAIEEAATQELQARLIPEIEMTMIASGNYGAMIELLPKGAFAAPYAFSLSAPFTAAYIQEYTARHIREIAQNTAAAIAQTINRNESRSINPITTAREVRQNIGLTARQEQAVANYRLALENGSKDALQRQLRDARFDSTVARAIADDKPLSKEQIDKMVTRYRERYIKYRSEVIARTEQLIAVSVGQRQSMLQGNVSPRLRRDWVYTHDGRERHWHATVPLLNPDGIRVDEQYLTQPPSGVEMLDMPRDPNGSAANIILCRCREKYRMV